MSEYQPQFPAAPRTARTNPFAVASMVLGITGVILFVLFAIPSILAVVFGLIALSQIRESGDTEAGSGMATAGIVLGAIETVVFFVALATGNVYINIG